MIFNSIEKHLYTIIILHGMFQTSKSLIQLANYIQESNKNIKVILPTAPKRNISWSNPPDNNISSWYNYYTKYDGELFHDDIDVTHFIEQTKRIEKIIAQERKYIDNKNILISGISQGGTLAFNIGLKLEVKLGGIIGIHTVFMDNIISTEKVNRLPIYLLSGEKDDIYNIKLQKNSINKLESSGVKITKWYIEKNVGHCDNPKIEEDFLVKAIKDILHI